MAQKYSQRQGILVTQDMWCNWAEKVDAASFWLLLHDL